MPGFIDFKAIAERVDVEQVVGMHEIEMKRSGKEFRGCCYGCNGSDNRSLCIYPETNSFYCHHAKVGGDSIALEAHLNGTGMYAAAKSLQEQFGSPASAEAATAPTRPEGRTAKAQPPSTKPVAPFDPEVFKAKLVYSPEVEALGISEDDAARIALGWHPQRKAIYLAARNPDGSISGYIAIKDGQLAMPPRWITSNVVPLRKKA
jgi:DNA primase